MDSNTLRRHHLPGTCTQGLCDYAFADEICAGGCVDGHCAPPARLLINEVLTDSAGSPDTDAFVELLGPPGMAVDGFMLVGVNGNGGEDYNVIALSGQVGLDGFFVIAHPQANASLLQQADMRQSKVDYQNGPDSIQLRFDGVVVDALAYGTFQSTDVFAGEGQSAVRGDVGVSIGRDRKSTDTDVNANDFTVQSPPTPGAPNGPMPQPPVASLSCPTTATLGEEVTLDASATRDEDGTVVTFAFDVGDDSAPSVGSASTVVHAYQQAGGYTAVVVVTDNDGLMDEATCTILVNDPGHPPVARLACPSSVNVHESILLDASLSWDEDGSIVEHLFDFGDGTSEATGLEATASHTYDQAGNYTVSVTVTDDMGLAGTDRCQVTVINQPPLARLDCPMQANRGVAATFDASLSNDSDGELIRYTFSFGDGSADESKTSPVAIHTFKAGGYFNASVVVEDDGHLTASASCGVEVLDAVPTAVLECPQTVGRGLAATFDASASTDDGTLRGYTFTFGDNTQPVTQSSARVTHVFASLGTYQVTVSVEDDAHQVGSNSCQVVVVDPCGNGTQDPGEECDDGNTTGNDGCSDQCKRECFNGHGGNQSYASQLGGYSRVCTTAQWDGWYGYTEHWFTFTRSEPFKLEIDVLDPNQPQFCPTSYEPSPCNSGYMKAFASLRDASGTVLAGTNGPSGYGCGDLEARHWPILNNLPAGTYWIRLRVDSNGYGFDCDGHVYYVMDLNFSAP